MNAISHLSILVSQAMAQSGGLDHAAATRQVSLAHPEMATLARAFGKPLGSVQFLNTRFANAGKAATRRQFQEEVQRVMKDRHLDYDTAFRAVQTSRQFANSADMEKIQRGASGQGGVPAYTSALADVFRLPRDLDPAFWAAAWNGNQKDWPAINYAKAFQAIADKLQSQSGQGIEEAVAKAKQQFPDLFKAVEELAKLSF
jgi:hypothetical protein